MLCLILSCAASAQLTEVADQTLGRLRWMSEWPSPVENVGKLPPPGQMRCDHDGNVYVRIPYPQGEVEKLDQQAYRVTNYHLTDQEFLESTQAFNLDSIGNVHAAFYRYDQNKQHGVPVIVVFDEFGNKQKEVKLDGLPQDFKIMQLAVFANGSYFVSGKRMWRSPLNAVFTAEGKLVKMVIFAGDDEVHSDSDLSWMTLNNDAVAGIDGRVYVTRRITQESASPAATSGRIGQNRTRQTNRPLPRRPGEPDPSQNLVVVINAISPDGTTVRFALQTTTVAIPLGLQEYDGRLAVQLSDTRTRRTWFYVMDEITGAGLSNYDGLATSSAFACYQGNNEYGRFTLLRVSKPNDRLVVGTAKPQ